MFRKVVSRLGMGALLLIASVAVVATASGGSAGLNFVTPVASYSHDLTGNVCPGLKPTLVSERHYCLVVTTYTNFKKSGGVEVDLTLQNYDQSSLTNPLTHLKWAETDANLSFVSSDGPATCAPAPTTPTTGGQVDCSFPNVPGLGSSAGSVSHTECPAAPVPPSGPICSTVKLFFSVNASVPAVHFTATADVKESQTNGANLDSQIVDATSDPTPPVMVFDDGSGAGADADATISLPQAPTHLDAVVSPG